MNSKEVRWKQRFINFEKAFYQLKEAVVKFDTLEMLEKEGMVQRFEYTFELAKNTLKDFLESKGEEDKYPREIIKKAFQLEIIDKGEVWLDMLEKRNLMAHTYDEANFRKITENIKYNYFVEIEKLVIFFQKENEQ